MCLRWVKTRQRRGESSKREQFIGNEVQRPDKGLRTSGSSGLRPIFAEEQGIRAGWSALLFFATYQVLDTIVTAALGHFISLELVLFATLESQSIR
jgi:hypothetical protein